MDIVPEGEFVRLFDRYLTHVRAWLRGQKMKNASSGAWEEPSATLMEEVEGLIGAEGPVRRFREDLLSKVAAWSLENPEESVDLMTLFAAQVELLAKGTRERSAGRVRQMGRDILLRGTDEFGALPELRRKAAEEALHRLITRYGYCPLCAPTAIATLLENGFKERGAV
jgi:serine protein kinase